MADRLLVLLPHEHTHAPRSILEQARKLGPHVTETRAIKHTMELRGLNVLDWPPEVWQVAAAFLTKVC